jgi:hypothetical protein
LIVATRLSPLQPLTLAGAQDDPVRAGAAAARLDVDAVETAGPAAVAVAQILGEASVRRVEVEESSRHRRTEAMDEPRRGRRKPARAEQHLLVVHEHRELAVEDVERVDVLPVDVRARSIAGAVERRLGDAELVEARLDHDPAAEERLALTAAMHDPCHRARV